MKTGYRRSREARKEYFRAYRIANMGALKAKARARYLRNRTVVLAKIAAKRPQLHGLTSEQYDVMLRVQGGACAVCVRPFTKTPNIDHDHGCCDSKFSCGRCVRGLLCTRCNLTVALGETILSRALTYIDRPDIVAVRRAG